MDAQPQPTGDPAPALTTDNKMLVWQTLAARRLGYDTMMWQTPSLGMTAQAFLFTLALASGSSPWARLIAALLSLVLSLLVTQLMAKHRRHELLDSLLLERIEQSLGVDAVADVALHTGPTGSRDDDQQRVGARLSRSTPGPRRFWEMSSYELWMIGQGLFGIAALVIIALVAFGISDDVLNTR
jgi:hypothetical protein